MGKLCLPGSYNVPKAFQLLSPAMAKKRIIQLQDAHQHFVRQSSRQGLTQPESLYVVMCDLDHSTKQDAAVHPKEQQSTSVLEMCSTKSGHSTKSCLSC